MKNRIAAAAVAALALGSACAPTLAKRSWRLQTGISGEKGSPQNRRPERSGFRQSLSCRRHGRHPAPVGGDLNKLREAAQNPVANLISVQFQDNIGFRYGPYAGTQNVLNFQPVVPIHLNSDWNLITRWVSPVVYQPRLTSDLGPEFGLGNFEPQFFLSPANPGKLIWGVGAATYLPTATDRTLGVNAWGVGPAVVGLTIQGPWVVGALVNNVWAASRSTR